MSFLFDPTQGVIFVDAELEGPGGVHRFRLLLDTGATDTLINLAVLAIVGYDPAQALRQVPVITASGIESMYLFEVLRLKALGQDRLSFPVLGHTLPPDSPTEGVLGLDFLRGHILTVDFQQGTITLV